MKNTIRGLFAVALGAFVVVALPPATEGATSGDHKKGAPRSNPTQAQHDNDTKMTGKSAPVAQYSASEESDTFFFSWGVPMGELYVHALNAEDTNAVFKVTNKKISANKKANAKIAAEMNNMLKAKTVSEAKRALARFESAVKAYQNGYVSGYGKWPLRDWEVAGEMANIAKQTIAALEDIIAKTASEAVKDVYGKQLVEHRASHEKLKKRYEKMLEKRR